MADENQSAPPPAEPLPEEKAPENPPPEWEYRKGFKIVGEFTKIIGLAKDTTQMEINRLRKKIDKLTYGS